MAKLPYVKTTIRDLSQFINIGDGTTSLNIATIINSKTGPMERVTLTSFDDLLNYYCTGTLFTQKDDVTVQCVGAMLNYSPVDVIRVGTSRIRVGKTDDGKIIYTDNNWNLINKLTRLKFTDNSKVEDSQAISTDFFTYYVGDKPEKELDAPISENPNPVTCSVPNLVKLVYENVAADMLTYDTSTITYEKETNFYDTYLTEATPSFLSASMKVTMDEDNKYVGINDALVINEASYVFVGDSTVDNFAIFDNPKTKIKWFDNESMNAKKFFAMVVAEMPENDIVAYKINYDFQYLDDWSDNMNDRINTKNMFYSYNKGETYTDLYIVKDHVVYRYNNSELPEKYSQPYLDSDGNEMAWEIINVNETETDFSKILNLLERTAKTEIVPVSIDETIGYFQDSNMLYTNVDNNPFLFDDTVDGVYTCKINKVKYQTDEYSIYVDGYVYYCGEKEPTIYDDVIEFISLEDEPLTFDAFMEALMTQLQADLVIGIVNMTTVMLNGDVPIKFSENLKIKRNVIVQSEVVKKSKFALVAKFPTTRKLFSFNFIRNTEIEDYDIIDLTWIYNQMSGTISFGFDENCVDGFGTLLYYNRYNEGDYENSFFHIMHFNDFVKWSKKDHEAEEMEYIDSFGNELIMPDPQPTAYADALAKFEDYDDKQYSFIWDSGYASPILARKMNTLALDLNAQFVPSFPPKYNTVDQVKAYHQSLGLNTFQGVEVVPSFKSTYCGSFLTTVPGGFAYIVARVNSFKNVTSEFQPLFGPTRGAVAAPNLMWAVNKKDQQKLADMNINTIVSNIHGTYLNFNLTSQKVTSYLSEEQNVYMSNCIAHVCQEYNPKLIAELNNVELWNTVVNQLTQLIEIRMFDGKKPTMAKFRVICDGKLNTQDVIEARQLKYKVECQFYPSVAYVLTYLDVVRLNSF